MMRPDEFLKQAKDLVAKDEAGRRSAVSRAYYSLYHETLLKLKDKKPTTLSNAIKTWRKTDSKLKRINYHFLIPEILTSINLKDLATNFGSYRDKRNESDYDIDIDYEYLLNESNTKVVIDDISRLINELKEKIK